MASETATLGGGCFWCVEAVLSELSGVTKLLSGYAGGEREDPSYEQVCTGSTGHAEVVQVSFDPEVISYEQLLDIFLHIHDPTTLNRQGNDIGTQYRSVIFYHSERQRETAKSVLEEANSSGHWTSPIVTELSPLATFYEAEAYHQDYFRKNPTQAYCVASIPPKLKKLRKKFSQFLV